MSKQIAIWTALLFTLIRLGAVEPHAGGAEYQRLQQPDEKAKRVVTRLEEIVIEDISFDKHSAAEALDYLTKKAVGEKGGGVINTVVRGADEAKGVGITGKSMNFARAVDEICRQSGREWKVDFNEISGAPLLVMTNKDAQRGGVSDSPSASPKKAGIPTGNHD